MSRKVKMIQDNLKLQFPERHTIFFAVFAIMIGLGIGFASINFNNPLALSFVGIGIVAAISALLRPELGLLILMIMTFTRFSDILVGYHGFPSTYQPFLILLTIATVLYYLRAQRRPQGIQPLIISLMLYGLVVFLSLIYAKDVILAEQGLENYAKDAFIAVLVVLLVQRANFLRQVFWALLLVAIVLGTLSTYQYFTGTFTNPYWGFGQANFSTLSGEGGYRIGGPFQDSPFYGQILIIFVPLALNRMLYEKQVWMQCLAGWALAVSLLSIILTFSRGAFIGLIVIGIILIIRRRSRPLGFAAGLLLIGAIITLAPNNYLDRVGTISEFAPIFGQSDIRNESSFRGRTSENIVAMQMFRDHPILGVGIGNYNARYIEYSSRLGIDPRLADRSAHSLYLEVLAESGILGILVFGGILYVAFNVMRRSRNMLSDAGHTEGAEMIQALSLAFIGYLIAGLFLHLAFARPFWSIIGLAFASLQIAKNTIFEDKEEN
jgi:putative inorganic carbon (hco3(-)) transporter